MVRIKIVLLFFGLAMAEAVCSDLEVQLDIDLGAQDYKRLNRMRHLSEEFIGYYQNITVRDLVPEGRLPTTSDLQCYADFAQVTAGLASGSLWAYRSEIYWPLIHRQVLNWLF